MKFTASMALIAGPGNLRAADRLRSLGASVCLIQVTRRIETLEIEASPEDNQDIHEIHQILNDLEGSLVDPGYVQLAESSGEVRESAFFGTPEAAELNEQLRRRLQLAARGLRLEGRTGLSPELLLH